MTRWIVTILHIKRIKRRINLCQVILIHHRRIETAQAIDRIAGMRIEQKHAIRRRQTGKCIGALRQLIGTLAIGDACLGNCLIKGCGGTTARKADQNDFGNARLFAQKFYALLNVQSNFFEIDARFIIIRARIHTQHHKAAFGQFACTNHIHEIGRAMNGQKSRVRRRSVIGDIESTFGRRGLKLNIARIRLRLCSKGEQTGSQSQRDFAKCYFGKHFMHETFLP